MRYDSINNLSRWDIDMRIHLDRQVSNTNGFELLCLRNIFTFEM
jgi:hypothetical protein